MASSDAARKAAVLSGSGDRHRLLPLVDMFDHGTLARLASLGVQERWHCLEVGAGCGSIARWLCSRVGATGRVVATELDTSLLDGLAGSNLEVRRHDLVRDELETDAFDLVHARLVLEHLADPEAAFVKLVRALRPGGVIVLEDLDWDAAHPASRNGAQVFARVTAAMRALWCQGTYHPTLGAELMGWMHRYGLEDIDCEGRVRPLIGGSERAATFFGDVLLKFAPLFIADQLLSREDILKGVAWARHPECIGVPAMLIAAWGRRR